MLLAFAGSWAIAGEFTYTSSKVGVETVTVISKSDDPNRFWTVIGAAFAVGALGLIVTGRGHHRIQQNENKPKA